MNGDMCEPNPWKFCCKNQMVGKAKLVLKWKESVQVRSQGLGSIVLSLHVALHIAHRHSFLDPLHDHLIYVNELN